MRYVLLLLGTAFLLVGCLGVVASWVVHSKHSRAYVHGVRVNAEVVRKYFLGAADGSSEYMIEYRFSLPSKEVQEGAAEVPEARWQALQDGERILLAYLPEEPRRVVLVELGPPSVLLPIFITAVSLAMAGLGVFVLFSSTHGRASSNAA